MMHFKDIKFTGKLMLYKDDKFLAIIEGPEGLMLGDYVIDKELLYYLTNAWLISLIKET